MMNAHRYFSSVAFFGVSYYFLKTLRRTFLNYQVIESISLRPDG